MAHRFGALAAIVTVLAAPPAASAQPADAQDWPRLKCERYSADWREALRRLGHAGLSADFIAAHEEFLKQGCPTPGRVCPRSPQELAFANILTIRAMNAGTASTFLPFRCPR
ncbi:MAG: hypothetical protein ACRCUX_04045 [Beijerinckiaceae bacterium]